MRLFTLVLLFFGLIAPIAAEEPPELPPLDPKYEAEHAMVLVN